MVFCIVTSALMIGLSAYALVKSIKKLTSVIEMNKAVRIMTSKGDSN